MAAFIGRFQPGECRDGCFCTRCCGGSPYTWDVTLFGTTYTLTRSRVTGLGDVSSNKCIWLWTGDQTIGCDRATYISLEVRSGDILLQVRDNSGGSNVLRYRWLNTITPQIDCLSPIVMTGVSGGTCGTPADVTITPGPDRTCCGDCGSCEGSSGDSGAHACANGCCTQGDAPLTVDADLGAGGWLDGTWLGGCNQCNEVAGVYQLDATSPLLGCGWTYYVAVYCQHADCDAQEWQFQINLARRAMGGGLTCRWELSVKIFLTTSECDGATVEAVYHGDSTELLAAACSLASPKTLTKVSDSGAGSPFSACDGALPDTCTIQAA